jgi:hypothetical protein
VQLLKSGAAVTARRRVTSNSLGCKQAFDPVEVLGLLGDQPLALAPRPPTVLVRWQRRVHHRADPALATPECRQGAQEHV